MARFGETIDRSAFLCVICAAEKFALLVFKYFNSIEKSCEEFCVHCNILNRNLRIQPYLNMLGNDVNDAMIFEPFKTIGIIRTIYYNITDY